MDDLAIEDCAIKAELAKRGDDARKFIAPILAVAAEKTRLAPVDPRDHTIAVEFDLMEPILTRRHRVGERRKLRCERARQFGSARAGNGGRIDRRGARRSWRGRRIGAI